MKRARRGLFLPALFSSVMVAGIVFTAQLSQLVATARHVVRIDEYEQARLLAGSIGRLKAVPAGTVVLSVDGAAVRIDTDPDGKRRIDVRCGAGEANVY